MTVETFDDAGVDEDASGTITVGDMAKALSALGQDFYRTNQNGTSFYRAVRAHT